MAIFQISRIQLRRGVYDDLPQLASAEMGWSIDTRQLFIGNGTLAEDAPTEGITEILTVHSDFLSFITSYVFKGTESGYTSQTGVDTSHPTTRNIQSVLDESALSIKSFGAIGDGITDDTAAINRAIQEIYVSSLIQTYPQTRRKIKFPAGTYTISGTILIPPYVSFIGDGKNNTIISAATGTVFETCDSLFQTDGSMGTNGATMPTGITIEKMSLVTAAGTDPVLAVDSVTDFQLTQVSISGPATVNYLINHYSSVSPIVDITYKNCTFTGGSVGINFSGYSTAIRIKDSAFYNCSTVGIAINSLATGVVSENNYFSGVTIPVQGLTGNNYSYGDTISGSTIAGGIYSGSAKYGTGTSVIYNTAGSTIFGLGTSTIITLANGGGIIDYQLTTGTNFRFGQIKYSKSSGTVVFDDEYTEPASSLGANLFANSTGVLTCTVTGASTLQYNIKQFI